MRPNEAVTAAAATGRGSGFGGEPACLDDAHGPRVSPPRVVGRVTAVYGATALVALQAADLIGEDAAAEVGGEVVLDPARDAVGEGIGLGGVGQTAGSTTHGKSSRALMNDVSKKM